MRKTRVRAAGTILLNVLTVSILGATNLASAARRWDKDRGFNGTSLNARIHGSPPFVLLSFDFFAGREDFPERPECKLRNANCKM